MYKHTLRAADQYFARDIPLPKNAAVTCEGVLAAGAHCGSLAVTVAATGQVTLAAGKAVSLAIEQSEDGTAFAPHPAGYTCTFAEALTAGDKDVLVRFALPDCARHIKVKLSTTDAAAAGNVDVFLEYLAR